MGPCPGRPPGRGRRGGTTGLEPARPRRDEHPGPPARRGGQKGGGDQALGRSRGGWGTKLHLRTERGGKPLCWSLTVGQRHEATQVTPLLERGAVARPGAGRSRLRPDRVAGDKGYTGRTIRGELRRRGIGAVIPRQSSEPRRGVRRGVRFDRAADRERHRIERTINRLKHHRAIATRSEKLAETDHALVTIAAILLWIPV